MSRQLHDACLAASAKIARIDPVGYAAATARTSKRIGSPEQILGADLIALNRVAVAYTLNERASTGDLKRARAVIARLAATTEG